jgi:hypothetical protein
MKLAEVIIRALLLSCAALAAACDRSPPAPSPASDRGAAPAAPLKAANPACSLPLRHFAPSYLHLRGNVLEPPVNRVLVDRSGTVLWNSRSVGARLLEDYVASQASAAPPPILYVTPDREAPCAAVRQVLSVALRAGRCRPDRCAFEWPGTNAPPDPPPAPEGEAPAGGG